MLGASEGESKCRNWQKKLGNSFEKLIYLKTKAGHFGENHQNDLPLIF